MDAPRFTSLLKLHIGPLGQRGVETFPTLPAPSKPKGTTTASRHGAFTSGNNPIYVHSNSSISTLSTQLPYDMVKIMVGFVSVPQR